jgi:hypothetical protein
VLVNFPAEELVCNMKLNHYNDPILRHRWISNTVDSSVGFLRCFVTFGTVHSLGLIQRRVLKISKYTVLDDVTSVAVDENGPST